MKDWQDLYISRSFVAAEEQIILLNQHTKKIEFLFNNFPIKELSDVEAKQRFLSLKELWHVKCIGIQITIYNLKHSMAFDYWVHNNNDDAWNDFIVIKKDLDIYFQGVCHIQLNCDSAQLLLNILLYTQNSLLKEWRELPGYPSED